MSEDHDGSNDSTRRKRRTPYILFNNEHGAIYVKRKGKLTQASLMTLTNGVINWGVDDNGEEYESESVSDLDNNLIRNGYLVNHVMLSDFTIPTTRQWLDANKHELARRWTTVPNEHGDRLLKTTEPEMHRTNTISVAKSEKRKLCRETLKVLAVPTADLEDTDNVFIGIRYTNNSVCNDILVKQELTTDGKITNQWFSEKDLILRGHADKLKQLYDNIADNRKVKRKKKKQKIRQ